MRVLQGRTALITGGSQGLGLAIAKGYLQAGASVMLCARSASGLEAATRLLEPLRGVDQVIHTRVCDVGDPAAVDALMAATRECFPELDILVNNAGVYGPLGTLETVDWGEWVEALRIDLLGTVYLCRAVIGPFKARGRGKIINLSGGGATQPLPRISAYATAKAGVVRFTETLAEEVAGYGIEVNAVAPGALNTRLLDQVVEAGPERVGEDFHRRMVQIKADGGTELARGVELCVWLGSSASDGISGRLLSAVWDPWRELPGRKERLRGSDIYTLRRIVPRERGEDWGEG
ncbi:MAG: SDR family oxidoreductase [Magnetococcales bacterium]|nr:SDR family oxidoreductase [Magnetococcales bacterium]